MNENVKKSINLTSIIKNLDKADILLVWSKFKPAAMIELSYFPSVTFSKRTFHKKVSDLKKILRDLRLEYRLHLNYPKSRKELTKYSLIARNKKNLKKLIAAEAEKNIYKRQLRLGTFLGYPRTAVKAFANNTSINISDLPAAVRQKPELKFLNFRLSKKWRTELIYLKKRAETICCVAPELYQKIIK